MNYEEALHELYHQLPVFQRSGGSAYKPGLDRTLALLEANGNPHQHLTCIHVAGTNGKGSVSHMLCSVLMESGYRCGLFTSPHLVDFRERIKINGNMISKEAVCRFTEKNKPLFDSLQPSFFEAATTLALAYFVREKTDIVILETGMGGRLDSTNIVTPLVSVITNIGMDHAQYLGNTIALIAAEKAGIIKKNIPVVVGEANTEVRNVFDTKARECNTEINYAEDKPQVNYQSALKALYQRKNIQTVYHTCDVLLKSGIKISEKSFARGLENVIQNTGLRGRYEFISQHPRVVCDAAHNQPGMKVLVEQLQHETYNALHVVIGMAKDKDITPVLAELPTRASYYFTQAPGERSMPAEELRAIAGKRGLVGNMYSSVTEALNTAKENAGKNDLVLVTGSFFVLAEVLK